MKTKISATQLSRDLATVLDQVRRRGDSYLIEQDGEAIATLEPAAGVTTWSSLAKDLHSEPRPDLAFADDLEQIQRRQPELPDDAWHS